MATNVLTDFVKTMENYGVYDVALPFLLVFTLVFAVLERSHILGDKKRNLNMIISLILAAFFIRNEYLVALINRFLPNVSLFLVVILMFLLLLGIIYGKAYGGLGGSFLTIGAIFSVVAIIWSLSSDFVGRSGVNLPRWLTDITPETRSLIIFIAAFILVIWWATGSEKDSNAESWGKKLNDDAKTWWPGKSS